ncbi:MAG: hypothetical protein H6Q84_876 [Deltaproteobacteria bacterium]|nr:hypothetical protein [Deltaproteobacteria bacterium]
MKKASVGLILALSFAFLPLSAHAEEKTPYDLPWERFSIQVGPFFSVLSDTVTVGSEGTGVAINLERALGLETQNTSFRVGAMYRFGETRRNRVDLQYFYFNREASKTLGQDILVDNVAIGAGTNVDSTFNFQVLKAAYSYSFLQDDRMDLAASIGLFIMPIKFELVATGVGATSTELNFTAPLPVIGLRGDFAITPRVFLRMNIDFFYLSYENFRGALMDTGISLDYNPWKNFGIGVGLENYRLALEAEGEDYPSIDLEGLVKMQFVGVQLYLRYFF